MKKNVFTKITNRWRNLFTSNTYNWWIYRFIGVNEETNETKMFFISYSIQNSFSVTNQEITDNFNQATDSYIIVKAGVWEKDADILQEIFPIYSPSYKNNQLMIEQENIMITSNQIKGSCHFSENNPTLVNPIHTMRWNLQLEEVNPPMNHPFSLIIDILRSKTIRPSILSRELLYNGEVVYNGKTYLVKNEYSFSHADQRNGLEYFNPTFFVSSSHLKDKDTNQVLTGSSIRLVNTNPSFLGIPFKKRVMGTILLEGKKSEYNFLRILNRATTSFKVENTKQFIKWKIIARNEDTSMELTIQVKRQELITINPSILVNREDTTYYGAKATGHLKIVDSYGKVLGNFSLSHIFVQFQQQR